MTLPPELPGSATDPSFQMPGSRRRPWLLGVCLPLALACAFVPAASLHAMQAPGWLVAVAVLAVFPLLPLVWHLIAERGHPGKLSLDGGGLERMSARSLGVGLLVLAISLANLGPRAVGRSVMAMARPGKTQAVGIMSPAPKPSPPARPAGAPPVVKHELEPYIPADARSVLALSDGSLLRQLLAGATDQATREKVAAFEKCQILPDQAKVLVAARGPDARLIVLRAPGVTDPRNLYCLAGVLGSERMRLRFTSDKAPIRFEVEGMFPRPLKFTAVDDRTVLAVDGPWGDAVERKLFPPGTATSEGPLLPVLDRVDRGASLWSAGVFQTAEATSWDLAMDARVVEGQLRLRASSVPASGVANKAVVETSVPMAFFSALPSGALRDGLQGLLAALTAPAPKQ